MADISDLDRLIEDNVRAFEVEQLKRHNLTPAEREQLLDRRPAASEPMKDEAFSIGKVAAGVTSKSVWFERRRIHFAVIVGVAVGERRDGDNLWCWVDLNYASVKDLSAVRVQNILQADAFLVMPSQFTSFKVVPTLEDN